MIAVLILFGAAIALIQAAIVPQLVLDPWAAPVPACAAVAVWAAVRRPEETPPIALAAALVLGAVSVERAGWFLLAMLPAVGAAMALDAVSPRNRGLPARLGRAGAASAAGAIGYVALLALAAASGDALLEETGALAIAAVGTAILASIGVAVAAPFRRRPDGLFA